MIVKFLKFVIYIRGSHCGYSHQVPKILSVTDSHIRVFIVTLASDTCFGLVECCGAGELESLKMGEA
jgi:hypothetical protein